MLKNNTSSMHGMSDIGPNVPAFLIKLWKLVNDPETDDIISWSESNLSFVIHQPVKFSRKLLSLYYKHNNMASFIRQLNMYGFHKIVSEAGGLKNDKNWMEFAHQCFIKDHPYLLENIKRKLPNPKSGVIGNEQFTSNNVKNGTQSEILAKVLSDVNNLKGKQETWDARLAAMKRENEALWRELAIFRQKHLKQEQIINRLIHFIVTMVQPSRNVPLRRRYPLMLNDIQPVKKITKLSRADTANINHGSPTGPTIHEIDTTDVLIRNPEQSDITSNEDEFISLDLVGSQQNLIGSDGDAATTTNTTTTTTTTTTTIEEPVEKTSSEIIPEDWLEIEMMDENYIDPLTPINPADVNPAVAAATLRHLEGTNKKFSPMPPVTGPGKKNLPEKKVIYLTDSNFSDKFLKGKKPVLLKLDIDKAKSSQEASCDFLSSLSPSTTAKTIKNVAKSVVVTPSRKTKSSPAFEIIVSQEDTPKKGVKEEKNSSSDPFLKLDSLYNGTICEEQLRIDSPKNSPPVNVGSINSLIDDNRLSPGELVAANDFATKETESKAPENTISFEPDSMAIVCQQPSMPESLARELNSHVDTVQNEIDYLKEMLKGEGYTFDPNTLPWIFNDDPLSYGVLPALEEEDPQKKNEETGISGNELMAYGAPNLMDLVDMGGPTSNSQEWTNVFSSSTPTVSDLTTPLPSPSAFGFPTPAKKRKK